MNEDIFTVNENGKVINEKVLTKSKTYGKVFLYFGLAFLISGVVALTLASVLFTALMNNRDSFFIASMVILVVSSILTVVCSLTINFKAYKSGSSLLLPYILYSIGIGGTLSGCAFWVSNPYIFGVTLLITALIFGLMAGLGFLIGDKVNVLFIILSGLLIGSFIIGIVNIFLLPFLFIGNESFYDSIKVFLWIGEFVFLFILMIYVAIDINHLKNVANSDKVISTNLALYFAASLYTDFITIFVRLLYIIALFAGSNRKN